MHPTSGSLREWVLISNLATLRHNDREGFHERDQQYPCYYKI